MGQKESISYTGNLSRKLQPLMVDDHYKKARKTSKNIQKDIQKIFKQYSKKYTKKEGRRKESAALLRHCDI